MADDQQHQEAAQRDALAVGVDRRDADESDFALGTHLVTLRRSYSHHGIYVGGGKVVHYAGFSSGIHRGPVKEVSLTEFASGRAISVKPVVDPRFSGAQVAARARSRLGEDRYRLTTNNCEHFCTWCVYGESRSEQVETFRASPRRAVAFAVSVARQFIKRGKPANEACTA